ncbi:hypothetical protein Taro_013187 [Colocasia esculenta]|uniref:Pentatricopeptide repeat-containing protein n=1 Tax=Colocasia esculenta TaxID=4460 RepID=A0A843UBE7_COLES|nr:hypothetical protein [Colocasia esculenta]
MPEKFSGQHFKRWQQRMKVWFTMVGLISLIESDPPVLDEKVPDSAKKVEELKEKDRLGHGCILTALSDVLFDVYSSSTFKTTKALWDELDRKYNTEDQAAGHPTCRRRSTGTPRNPVLAWRLFKYFISSAYPLPFLRSCTAILRILARAGMLPDIRELHHHLLLLRPPETACSVLTAFTQASARSGLLGEALSLFRSPRSHFSSVPPPVLLYNSLPESSLKGNRRLDDARLLAGLSLQGMELLNTMWSFGCISNQVIYNTLVSGFCTKGRTDEAKRLVERMRKQGLFPDVVTFSSRVSTLCKVGKGSMMKEAEDVVKVMRRDGDVVSYSSIINELCKAGRFDEARRKFIEMMKKDVAPDEIIYETFIHGFCKHGKLSLALKVLRDMEKRFCSSSAGAYNLLIQ